MEFGSILQFLENKNLFVTGVTGFLSKIFVEKILRVQPNVKKLYLLRASDATSASHRFHNEVIRKDLYRVAKEKLGANFDAIISKKINIISGDICYEDLGIKDSSLREEMKNELDIVLNFAATTRFDERYDIAFGTNTIGAKNVMCFAKLCLKLKLFVHISTGHLKENLPLVIIRPSMITSTYKEPFPGWIEGARTIDALTLSYGKGRLTFFVAGPALIIDVIPGDMVVNAIIVAMVAHANQPCDEVIYHVGSSVRNPIRCSSFKDYLIRHFTKKPWINQNGKPVKVVSKPTMLNCVSNFQRFIRIRYLPLLKGLKLANIISCQSFQGTYSNLSRRIKLVKRLVELYQPYLFFHGIFDDFNLDKLRTAAEENGIETDIFLMDPKLIDWDDYFLNTHIPGMVKYVF
ncbi:hypothetical protein GH714_015827 [Hevea brasiliensis]|uniref:Fatty acyl-CoA reductase n=1 Tax=Hevea brasiliensis TaxID=3981 RepID=A0A6A6LHB5_HEVBR|nr:hypothetical protein GH714_015827 [Hevea brasiliensis]